jgi:hypothetical protein
MRAKSRAFAMVLIGASWAIIGGWGFMLSLLFAIFAAEPPVSSEHWVHVVSLVFV